MELKNKTVLVTGADGFIGSHLVQRLVEASGKVKALSYYNSFNHWGWLEELDCLPEIEVLSGDVRDPHRCAAITKNVDVVFHLASLVAIPYSYVAPDSYVDTNIKGTLNMCQAVLRHGCDRMIHTSTSEVYGTARYTPIDEEHPLQAQSPYSASKIGADAIASSFMSSLELPLTIARPFNTYGPRQSLRAVIPNIILQIADNAEHVKLGDTKPTRDFNYVEDVCRGFMALAECDDAVGATVNIGSNKEITIGDLFELIKGLMQSSAEITSEDIRLRPESSEVYRLRCDNSKIRTLTGFAPKHSIRDGLKRTIRWYADATNMDKFKSHIYNT